MIQGLPEPIQSVSDNARAFLVILPTDKLVILIQLSGFTHNCVFSR